MITGVAHDRSEAKVTVTGVPTTPASAARIFRVVADAEIDIDMVLQNISSTASGRTHHVHAVQNNGRAPSPPWRKLKPSRLQQCSTTTTWQGLPGGRRHALAPRGHATFCEALAKVGVNIDTFTPRRSGSPC